MSQIIYRTLQDSDFNAAWNADFLDQDPTNPPQSNLLSNGQGGFIYKILRPDTNGGQPPDNPAVPEPSTLILTGIGISVAFFRRKKF